MRAEWGLAEYDDHPMGSTGEGAEHTAPNCEGFRLRGPWRGPSVLTSALSRSVLAHGPRQAESSETPYTLCEMARLKGVR